MVLFDKDGMVIAQKINQKLSHEEDHERLYDTPIKMKLNEEYNMLVGFVYNYMKTHVYFQDLC